ncbi:MAG TPA: SDR family oxidoreductase [Burkholderiales bacterium]|jgi:3-oxoacyl-[acyl-carrier protein] reductase
MDLGIEGRRAIVSGASKGLGRACAHSLAREGVSLAIVARTEAELAKTADEIRRSTGARVLPVAADIATAQGRARVLEAFADPDIVVNNAGGPPTGDFRDFAREDWLRALDACMLAPIEMMRLTLDGMIARRFGRIVNITSYSVKMPIDVLCLSNGARSGLTGFVAGLARKVAAHNVTINNLLPGVFDTDRQQTTVAAAAKQRGITMEEARRAKVAAIPAKRMGEPDELGDMCAWLCSARAGYFTGQNVLLDGGLYPGTF